MEINCRLIIFSKIGLCALTRDKVLPFEPRTGMRLVLSQGRENKIILVIERVDWIESSRDVFFVSCGTEHQCAGAHEGERVSLPFGQLHPDMITSFAHDARWNRIEGGDDFFTASAEQGYRPIV